AALARRAHRGAERTRRSQRRNAQHHGAVQHPADRPAADRDLSAHPRRRAVIYACCDRKRRDLVAASALLNGIDYLEVIDGELPASDPLRQRTLLVHCLKSLPAAFSEHNLLLLGGERVKNVGIDWAAPALPLPAQLTLPGEASTAAIVSAL